MNALRLGSAAFVFVFSLLALTHLSSAHSHGHSHSHGNDQEAGHEHSHAHSHSHSGFKDSDSLGWLSKFCKEYPQVSALIATAFISTSSLCVMPLLPFVDTRQKSKSGISGEDVLRSDALLKLMVSFAVGGLLGDVFLHLIPHAAGDLCEVQDSTPLAAAKVLGFPLLLGLYFFFVMEKLLHIMSEDGANALAEPESPAGRARAQKRSKSAGRNKSHSPRRRRNSREAPPKVQPAAYLNWLADTLHNFCDGLALAVTFTQGRGLSTTLAVFFHEVPHNLADFAILVQNGVSKRNALLAQFASALGAVAGCLAGLMLPDQPWLHCFVGGGFIYIATVGIVPALVNSGGFYDMAAQSLAMAFGVLMMVLVLYVEGH